MARIKSYANASPVVGADKWIGSDSQSNFATKNFTADAVGKFINENTNQLQSLRFKYDNTQSSPVNSKPGTIIFDPVKADNVAFSTLTGFILSKSELINLTLDISNFYTAPLITSDVLITECANPSKWAVYTWNSSVENAKDIDFYDIGLTYKAGAGGLTNGQDYFISLLRYGTSTGDKNFVFTQPTNAEVWVVDHNLDKFPSVTIVDTANTVITGELVYNSLTQCTLSFSPAPGANGKAFFN